MGHLINPVSFRLGRSIFWTNNFNYINNNFRLLKKKNFLFKFIFKILNWFFHEKFSLNFFYYRHRIYRKVSYIKSIDNLNNFFLNKYFFFNNFLKISKKLLKKKYLFYCYIKPINNQKKFNNINLSNDININLYRIKCYFVISQFFLKNYLSKKNKNLSDIGFDMFFWFSKQAMSKKISKIKIPKFVKLFKSINQLKVKNYFKLNNNLFSILYYFYSLNINLLNKKLKKKKFYTFINVYFIV